MTERPIVVTDLASVVYTAGRVFNGLGADRRATERFLRSSSLDGITSAADLGLLQDLRDLAEHVITHRSDPVDAGYVMRLNRVISRSGAIRNGELRRAEANIGVSTRYGRHEPPALTEDEVESLISDSSAGEDPVEDALSLFVALAKAQPFDDGNKRTALFAANGHLLHHGARRLVTVPLDDDDPRLEEAVNDALARAYVLGRRGEVMDLMRAFVVDLGHRQPSNSSWGVRRAGGA